MRFIIEKMTENITLIYKGKRIEKNDYADKDSQSSKYVYKLIYFKGVTFSRFEDMDITLHRSDLTTLTKHYKSFEDFMEDNLELFL